MSDCVEHLDALLEADPDVLAGDGGSELARHLRRCPRCAAAASAIREATSRIDATLDAPATSALDIDAIVARSRVETSGDGGPDPDRRGQPSRARWTALVAAAVAALIIVGERDPVPVSDPRVPTVDVLPVVEASSERGVAVLPTRNPQITIVWFFQGE